MLGDEVVSLKEVCGCGRPLKHLGRCAFRRKNNQASSHKKNKVRALARIRQLNAEFADAQGVALSQEGFVEVASPVKRMTPRQALIHASHLIAVADPDPASQRFTEVFAMVVQIYH